MVNTASQAAEAVENIDESLQVRGIDGVYVGPADLSLTLGLPPYIDHADRMSQDALATVLDACRRHRVVAGIQASAALAETRANKGSR
jgi:4-hydroxy-2-oxoheptanedioate aldolase